MGNNFKICAHKGKILQNFEQHRNKKRRKTVPHRYSEKIRK